MRILIVDDDEDDFIITSGYMRGIAGSSFIIDWAPTYKAGLLQLSENAYDIYFVDYRLGVKSGVDFLKEANALACDAPIVLLTGQGNHAVDIEAMQLGAVDYLVKAELNSEKIERCIRYALERANTLKALRSSEAKYRGIFEKTKDIIFVADKELRIVEVNDAVFQMLGYSKGSVTGKYLSNYVYYENEKAGLAQAVYEGAPIVDYPLTLRNSTGNKLYCTLTLSVDTDSPDMIFVQGIIHDISGLKKAEQAALQAEKLAATGRLVRTLAHEIRNPLNNITMSAGHLQRDRQDADAGLYLDIIMRSGTRINNLINELLHSSVPNEQPHKAVVLQRVLTEVTEASADRLTLKKMAIETHYPSKDVHIMADAENLKLALLNIVINAIEAMEDGVGKLTLELERVKSSAILKVSDNGCGISEENLTRIFEPYYTRKKTGAGLGLAFTLNILQAHNIVIDVSSQVGKGTTFALTFPIANS